MTFVDRLSQHSLGVRFYCRIRGIPYIFANFALPSAWDEGGAWAGYVAYGGDFYQWSHTLLTEGGLSGHTTLVNAKGGISHAGSQGLRFQLSGVGESDVWLTILPIDLYRSDIGKAVVQDDIATGDTSIVVDATSSLDGSSVLYLGLETIRVDSYDGDGVTIHIDTPRGRYGSQPLPQSVPAVGHGGWVTTRPIVWGGRVVDLWMCTGEEVGGVFVPYGPTFASDEDGVIWRGVINDTELDRELLEVDVSASDLMQLISTRQVARQLPTARCGAIPEVWSPRIQVDETNWHVHIRRVWPGGNFTSRLLRSDGMGGAELVPEHFYTFNQVIGYIHFTLDRMNTTFSLNMSNITFDASPGDPVTGEKPTFSISFNATHNANFIWELALAVELDGNPRSIWREFGFTEDAYSDDWEEFVSGSYMGTFRPNKDALPVFRHPPASYGKRRIVHVPIAGLPTFDPAPGWVDDLGEDIDGYARIGNEIVRFDEVSLYGTGVLTVPWIGVSGRAQFGSSGEEEIYVEWHPDPSRIEWVNVVQGLAFPNTSVERAALYMMLSGSGEDGANGPYDKGWRHCGAHIKEDLVDVGSFESRHALRLDSRDGIGVWEADELQDVLRDELILNQTPLASTLVNGEFQITLLDWSPPLEMEAVARVLDEDNIWSNSGAAIDADMSQMKLINRIDWESGWDHGRSKAKVVKSNTIQRTSVQTYGEAQPMRLVIRSFHGAFDIAERMASLANDVFARYSATYAKYALDVVSCEVWTYPLMGTVELTHPMIPNPSSLGRGVEALVCRLVGRADKWVGMESGAVRSRVTLVPSNGRFTKWAPALYLSSKSSNTVWTITNRYNRTGENDADYFQPGMWVVILRPGNEGTTQIRQIASITPTTLTLAGTGSTLAAPARAIFVDHDHPDVTAEQRRWLYMSDGGTHKLDLDGGSSVPPFLYL